MNLWTEPLTGGSVPTTTTAIQFPSGDRCDCDQRCPKCGKLKHNTASPYVTANPNIGINPYRNSSTVSARFNDDGTAVVGGVHCAWSYT